VKEPRFHFGNTAEWAARHPANAYSWDRVVVTHRFLKREAIKKGDQIMRAGAPTLREKHTGTEALTRGGQDYSDGENRKLAVVPVGLETDRFYSE
jgi:hypothetical protein